MTTNIILGGEGLIGRSLCRELAAIGEPVVSYDLKSGFDLRKQVPENVPADAYVWFLAWDVGGAKYLLNPNNQTAILENNVRLASTMFHWLRDSALPFTFTSSQMAGYPDAYGITKQLGEYWTNICPAGRFARLWNVYGVEPVSERSHAVTDFVAQALSEGTIQLLTKGGEERQFVTATDCARALISQRENQIREADVASGEWVSILSIAREISALTGARVIPGEREGFMRRVEPIAKIPGWAATESLRTGLAQLIDAMTDRATTATSRTLQLR